MNKFISLIHSQINSNKYRTILICKINFGKIFWFPRIQGLQAVEFAYRYPLISQPSFVFISLAFFFQRRGAANVFLLNIKDRDEESRILM